MYRIHSFDLVVVFLSLFIYDVCAITLRDLPPVQKRSWLSERDWLFRRRPDYSSLDLRSTESFIWGAAKNKNVVLGNLTVYMPDTNENILSLEKFKGMTKSIKCPQGATTMDITFKDDPTFAYAKKTWDWVNGKDNHSFIMVAGTGDCGWNTHRVPFIISTLKYDEKANIAHLGAQATDWKSAAHTYDLTVGSSKATKSAKLRKRLGEVDFNKDLSINFDHPLPFSKWKFPDPDIDVTLECDSCGTKGTFQFGFTLKTVLLVPKQVLIKLNPHAVSASITPKLTLSANYTGDKSFEHEFPGIPIDGINIPGDVLEVGPELVFSAGAELGALSGSASISSGIVIAIKDSAVVEIDLLKGHVDASGWSPTVTKKPMSLSAKLSAETKLFVKAKIELAAKAFGHGYDIGVYLSPFISASLEGIASTTGACPNDKSKHEFGVNIDPKYGAEIVAEAENSKDKENPLFEVTIASIEQPLAGTCLAFGPKMTGKPKTTQKPTTVATSPAKTTAKSTPTSSVGSSPAACTQTSGLAGTCISTSACTGQGGKSEAGHCPGGSDIQCCAPKSSTQPPKPSSSSSPTCKNNAGVSGTCIATSACAGQGGVSEAGHCPGAADIQCCTPKSSTPPSKPSSSSFPTCKNNAGVSGTCIATSACAGQGGVSEAGHCPGAADIQCCTPKSATAAAAQKPTTTTTQASSAAPTCTNKAGLSGTCIVTSACAGQGGVSEAGHCPGTANIQCCTIPKPTAAAGGGGGGGGGGSFKMRRAANPLLTS